LTLKIEILIELQAKALYSIVGQTLWRSGLRCGQVDASIQILAGKQGVLPADFLLSEFGLPKYKLRLGIGYFGILRLCLNSRGRLSGGRCCQTGTFKDAAATAMAAAAQRHSQVGNCYLHTLVEVHDRRWSRPPCHLTPAGGGDARCLQVNVITKARESVARALALPFALDIMRRVLPLWRPSRPLPSLFSSMHHISTSRRL
jgi:hypothetical protein